MRFALVAVAGGVVLACSSGCRQTAIRPDDRRTQFEQYDRSRSEYVEPYVRDEFGRRQPNLRGRLLGAP